MDFNQNSAAVGNRELIPGGTLAWGLIEVKSVKLGQKGSRFAELEVTISEGPYEKRKVFTNLGDPSYDGNSEKYREMGYGALSRMMESSGLVNVQDPASYQRVSGQAFDTLMAWLDGKRVAFKVKVEKGADGYPDKNTVGDWLSPNPQSSSSKDFQKLIAGAGAPAVAGAPAPMAPAPSWGNQAQTAAAPAAAPQAQQSMLGFTPAAPAGAAPFAGNATAPAVAPMQAPIGGPAPGGAANPPMGAWLQQAQGQKA